MDTSTYAGQGDEVGKKRRWRTKAERRGIVEETLVPGASVARVARLHDVNANQVFHWRQLYREGRLGTTSNFLPVRVAHEQSVEAVKNNELIPQPGAIEIKLSKGTLRVVGAVDVIALRAVVECLV